MKLLSVAEASEVLDVPMGIRDRPRWLRRHLKRRERETGRALLVRVGEGTARATYRVDMDAVRVYCPELVSSTDKLAKALRGCAIVGQRALLDQTEAIADIVERLAILTETLRRIERQRGKPRGRAR